MRLLSDFVKTISSPSCFDFLPEGDYVKAANEGGIPKTVWRGKHPLLSIQGNKDEEGSLAATTATATTQQLPPQEGTATGSAASDVNADD